MHQGAYRHTIDNSKSKVVDYCEHNELLILACKLFMFMLLMVGSAYKLYWPWNKWWMVG
jgi:hypothetical protein